MELAGKSEEENDEVCVQENPTSTVSTLLSMVF